MDPPLLKSFLFPIQYPTTWVNTVPPNFASVKGYGRVTKPLPCPQKGGVRILMVKNRTNTFGHDCIIMGLNIQSAFPQLHLNTVFHGNQILRQTEALELKSETRVREQDA